MIFYHSLNRTEDVPLLSVAVIEIKIVIVK